MLNSSELVETYRERYDEMWREFGRLEKLAVNRLKEKGCCVHIADGATEAASIVQGIVGAESVVKSHSATVTEININTVLSDIRETEISEYIAQLEGNNAISGFRGDVAAASQILNERYGSLPIKDLSILVRQDIRRIMTNCRCGITGINAIVAETGSLFFFETQGNVRGIANLADVHIAVAGIDKIVETTDDALLVGRFLADQCLHKSVGNYLSFNTGPSQTGDVEGVLVKGMHGPREVHVVLLDNGRRKALRRRLPEVFACMDCRLCLNDCHAFATSKGRYGSPRIGGKGALLAYFATGDSSGMEECSNCGNCARTCPLGISWPDVFERAGQSKKEWISMEHEQSSKRLQQEVMTPGWCTSCGMCVGICPYIKNYKESSAFIHQCQLDEGNCYAVCPRGETAWSQMDQKIFGRSREDHALGNFENLYFARATDKMFAEKGQYAGVTSALLGYAINKGQIDGAIVTDGKPGKLPEPKLARTRGDLLAAAGSKYSAAPTLSLLNQAAKEGFNRLAVVGRPCQVLAVKKMQSLTDKREELPVEKVALTIGLFCFWSLTADFYQFLLQKTNNEEIQSLDIPVDGMVVKTNKGEYKWPIDEIRSFIRPTCEQCFDPTSEFADVSVGATEFDNNWNTLIVRTDRGKELVKNAVSEGVLEVKEYPHDRIPLLRQAVLNKKQRVLKQTSGGDSVPSYLMLNEAYRKGVLEGGN